MVALPPHCPDDRHGTFVQPSRDGPARQIPCTLRLAEGQDRWLLETPSSAVRQLQPGICMSHPAKLQTYCAACLAGATRQVQHGKHVQLAESCCNHAGGWSGCDATTGYSLSWRSALICAATLLQNTAMVERSKPVFKPERAASMR